MNFLNVIVDNPHFEDEDIKALFPEGEDIKFVKENSVDMFDLLMELGAFKSKGQVRKNWTGPKKIPFGFSDFVIGKLRRQLTIWNPQLSVVENPFFKSSLMCNVISGEI